MIRNVGHVRVFAALASMISACFILFAAWPNEYFWFVMRMSSSGFAFQAFMLLQKAG